ncbi:hypothetical protein [Lysobacter fragariae]
MSNPFIARGHPRRFLAAAIWDFVIAAATGAMWLKLIPFDHPWLHQIPEWVWPAATAFFVAYGLWALWLHMREKNKR